MSGLERSLRGLGSSNARSEEWSAHFLEESALVDARNSRNAQAPFFERCGEEEGDGKIRGTGVTVLSPKLPELRTANFELLIALF
jgi:hypothetical protein